MDAKNADGYLSLGFVDQRRGKVLAAEELYSKALALDESNPEGLHRYSDLLGDVGRLDEAVAIRRRLQGVEPFVPVFNTQTAQFLWLHGEQDEAIAILKDIPQDGRNRTTKLAMIYSATHRYREAADALLETPPGVYSQEIIESAERLCSWNASRSLGEEGCGNACKITVYKQMPVEQRQAIELSLAKQVVAKL